MAKSALEDAADQAGKALSFLFRWGNDEPVADLLSGQSSPGEAPRRASAPPPPPDAPHVRTLPTCRSCGVAHFDACDVRDVAAYVRRRADDARTITVRAEPAAPDVEPARAPPPPSAAAGACTFCGGGGTVPLQGADRRWHLVACPECKKDRR